MKTDQAVSVSGAAGRRSGLRRYLDSDARVLSDLRIRIKGNYCGERLGLATWT